MSAPFAPPTAAAALFQPLRRPAPDPAAAMRERLLRTGQWTDGQMAGRRWPVACVALEVTQRCNLDCTLCYLSDSAESLRDLPLAEVFRRIDLIVAHYGAGTDVQVSGGEPTLRARDELIAIVRRLAERGLRPTLMTNGIKATRELLTALAAAGLVDVAFHVDTTQQRIGYRNEHELNALRREYIERARGLRLGVFFNTSVHGGNLGEIPMLAAFFKAHADVVRFASFQLQADTGRGVLRERADALTQAAIEQALQHGVGVSLRFDTLLAGHRDCNRSAVLLVAGDHAWDAFDDERFVRRFMRETPDLVIDRRTPWRALRSLGAGALRRPALAAAAIGWAIGMAWRQRGALWRARGRVRKLTFFTHNFMDACGLQKDRIDACVFMAMTQHGPLSMCALDAQRDEYLLQPLEVQGSVWQPRTSVVPVKIEVLRGRRREAWLREREAARAGPAS